MKAEVLTQWVGDGLSLETANRPKIRDDHPGTTKYEDTTGQPFPNLQPDPNLYIIQIEAPDSVMAAIEADADYYVLWSE